MYIGQTRRVDRRKPAKCVYCKEEIGVGEPCIVVIRKATSKNSKKYSWTVYTHLDCFIAWTGLLKEQRAKYTANRKGGRPAGSSVQAWARENPELSQKRHKLIRERARLLRYLLATEDDERICSLTNRINDTNERLEGILKLQVPCNHRSKKSKQLGAEKMARAEAIERAKGQPELPAIEEAQPDPSARTIEEIDQDLKESLARSEAYQASGQVWKESSRD
jgi:hypothetical protein